MQIGGRGARSASPMKTYLLLADTVYRLANGKKSPVSPLEANALRVTAKNTREFLDRQRSRR
jgi:hypothetical protein